MCDKPKYGKVMAVVFAAVPAVILGFVVGAGMRDAGLGFIVGCVFFFAGLDLCLNGKNE
jgi:putative Ca2+/H+ antiporter (TMEM165/GDT1 family)